MSSNTFFVSDITTQQRKLFIKAHKSSLGYPSSCISHNPLPKCTPSKYKSLRHNAQKKKYRGSWMTGFGNGVVEEVLRGNLKCIYEGEPSPLTY